MAIPLLELDQSLVSPGDSILVTIVGAPGHFYAVASSLAGEGLVVDGQPIDLGPDAVLVQAGQLDARGRGRFVFTPRLDPSGKIYLQGATLPPADSSVLTLTPRKVVRSLP